MDINVHNSKVQNTGRHDLYDLNIYPESSCVSFFIKCCEHGGLHITKKKQTKNKMHKIARNINSFPLFAR